MRKLQMVDLQSQYQKIKSEIDAGIQQVLETSAYINGPEVANFQKELEQYLGVKHVIPCGNGTDALQIALMACNLQPGDEVITADFTFAATAEVIHLLGLKSVLVDVDYDTFTIDIEQVKKAITPKTKAIIPVHLFGQCVNMEPLLELACQHNLKVIEDNAQAIGADYFFSDGKTQKSGTMGYIGTTSFFPSKNLGTYGDGGAIFTNSDDIAHKMRGIVNHGMYKRYYHDVVGVNSRLDSVQATILRKKLPYLDAYNQARLELANFYDSQFQSNNNLIIPTRANYTTHVFHQYTLKVLNGHRDALKEHLDNHEIPNAIYYPIPLRKQKAYDNGDYTDANYPNTNRLVQEVLSLPMHTEMDTEQREFITKTLNHFFNQKN